MQLYNNYITEAHSVCEVDCRAAFAAVFRLNCCRMSLKITVKSAAKLPNLGGGLLSLRKSDPMAELTYKGKSI